MSKFESAAVVPHWVWWKSFLITEFYTELSNYIESLNNRMQVVNIFFNAYVVGPRWFLSRGNTFVLKSTQGKSYFQRPSHCSAMPMIGDCFYDQHASVTNNKTETFKELNANSSWFISSSRSYIFGWDPIFNLSVQNVLALTINKKRPLSDFR